jgi:hypothetical protein
MKAALTYSVWDGSDLAVLPGLDKSPLRRSKIQAQTTPSFRSVCECRDRPSLYYCACPISPSPTPSRDPLIIEPNGHHRHDLGSGTLALRAGAQELPPVSTLRQGASIALSRRISDSWSEPPSRGYGMVASFGATPKSPDGKFWSARAGFRASESLF